MLVIFGLMLVVLAIIAWEDYKFRAVHWWLFVLLFSGLGLVTFLNFGFRISMERTMQNSVFVVLQVLSLSIYFSLKKGKRVNIFKGYFGLGDLCFLMAMSIYLPLLSYVLFYVGSLLLVILVTVFRNAFLKQNSLKIPLAGYQAICLLMLMILDYGHPGINICSENLLRNYFIG
ncbi:hypothetical protein [Pedobacter sp. Leaf176]|uniref:hypothetical protein n=1 Tax=Pedobacter sp. Leaf176 TaxID=1736286 RepID=UPI0006F9604A|nr:hypothetical protein [Pedobacter sp. Leaf176]KQR70888.1 hypothetical protein ASF92_05635 [Pedobacter sp. Leaf176]